MRNTTFYQKPQRVEKFSRDERLELMFDLINSFRVVKNPIETADLLQDLLTSKEIKNLSIRLRIAKLLLAGKTHEEIVKTLHSSYTTVAKVSAWLTRGGKGFKRVIFKLPIKYRLPENLPPIPIEFQLPKVLATVIQYSAAKNQNFRLERFLKGVKEKEAIDKNIREYSRQKYGPKI